MQIKKALIDAADELKSKLALIHDLSSIEIRGDTDEEVVIQLDQKKLDAYDLDKSSVYKAISNISSIFPAGTLDGQGDHLYISTINGEKDAKALSENFTECGRQKFSFRRCG